MSTKHEKTILTFLADGNERFGAEIREAAGLSWWKPIYATLAHMVERGVLAARNEEIQGRGLYGPILPRRLFQITAAGRVTLEGMP